MGYRNRVVGTDASETAKKAVTHAAELGKVSHHAPCDVLIVHTTDG